MKGEITISSFKKNTVIHITEDQTIIELSYLLQKYDCEVFIRNESGNQIHEVNPKSVLGLATLQLRNGVEATVRAEGKDAEEAVLEVIRFFGGE
ncbi:HPr family phosphocarrier protein [Oceanobacillus neutriphilus]|uniref:HPr domain-containing protein n=1 Tax=Oceanobacillus neutriphilus TaxID=531815 RepID=A0ABQ2NT11_9BACI|nr:HPr family phosphocarrier protein [Oceanobacillus neutriphilus]GGP09567.1 hypothetical protein GCM10011346_14150 [Oceanobacillus neutriphilus]